MLIPATTGLTFSRPNGSTSLSTYRDFTFLKARVCRQQRILGELSKPCYKMSTQFGTQKCAERAVEAVDAVRIFPRKFSAC
jgi:hypothetical protein